VFVARPPAGPPVRRSAHYGDLHLARATRRAFAGPAEFLADAANRARVGEYLADMARPYACEVPAALFGEPLSPELGHSYGEMAEALIGSAVPADEPVDLLILAFSIHDLRPGRQTAAYLSHVTPGAPMAFAVCDQGSAAAFSGLRIAREYASSAGVKRALLIVVEQAALPYGCPVPVPSAHRGVAMLYSAGPAEDGTLPRARIAGLRQHPGVPPGDVAGLAAAGLSELTAGHRETGLVLSDALAAVWPAPAAGRVRVAPPGQPATGVWWELIDELADDAGRPDLVVAADYDPGLRYLCLTAFAA
jgi:4-hydroxymandelate oxidase